MLRLKRQIIFPIVFLFAINTTVACSTIFAREVRLVSRSTAVPASLFGLHIQRAVAGTAWPPIPFADWRLWDSGAYWPNLEPKQGEWNFDSLDRFVRLAQQHQVNLLMTLGATPTWASARPNQMTPYVPGSAAEPSQIEYWRDFVTKVATRYKGRIEYYEVWNEPNLPQFYSGSVTQMISLVREAYSILKQIDPSITVLSPACTGDEGLSWLDEYLSKGGGIYADVIGYHFYVAPKPPETIVPLVRKVRQIMVKHGIGNKPLWNTETGWVIANSQGLVDPTRVGFSQDMKILTMDEAAAYVARLFILGWVAGLKRVYWYAWDSHEMGLIEADGKTLKPPATAYTEVYKWLVGSQLNTCQADIETWTCHLTRAGGYSAWIVWNPDRQLNFIVPPTWNAQQIRDLTGAKHKLLKPTRIVIGPSPLLLEGLKKN